MEQHEYLSENDSEDFPTQEPEGPAVLTRPVSDCGADPSLVIWNNYVVYTETYGDLLAIQAAPYRKLSDDLPRIHRAPAAHIWNDALEAGRYPRSMKYLKGLNVFYATDLWVYEGELYA